MPKTIQQQLEVAEERLNVLDKETATLRNIIKQCSDNYSRLGEKYQGHREKLEHFLTALSKQEDVKSNELFAVKDDLLELTKDTFDLYVRLASPSTDVKNKIIRLEQILAKISEHTNRDSASQVVDEEIQSAYQQLQARADSVISVTSDLLVMISDGATATIDIILNRLLVDMVQSSFALEQQCSRINKPLSQISEHCTFSLSTEERLKKQMDNLFEAYIKYAAMGRTYPLEDKLFDSYRNAVSDFDSYLSVVECLDDINNGILSAELAAKLQQHQLNLSELCAYKEVECVRARVHLYTSGKIDSDGELIESSQAATPAAISFPAVLPHVDGSRNAGLATWSAKYFAAKARGFAAAAAPRQDSGQENSDSVNAEVPITPSTKPGPRGSF